MKAIEIQPIREIKCDAEGCDYRHLDVDDVREYLNHPCPKCGANLLTEADLALLDAMIAGVDWLNTLAGPSPDNAVRDMFKVHMDSSGIPRDVEPLGKEKEYKYTSLTEYASVADSSEEAGAEQRLEQMKWVEPEFGPGRVDAAGKVIAERRLPSDQMNLDAAFAITANWRSSHAYPLQVFSTILRNRAKQVDSNALVVQRLKRMPSIVAKLKRFERMQLSQMQDLGGCRAIVDSIADAWRLASVYEHNPCITARFFRKHDYIANPKPDGYRGIHLVYEYQSRDSRRSIYNGSRIEIQVRSHAQHIWATAVETVDTFTEQSLKSGMGHKSWKRFFALMSGWIRIKEERQAGASIPGILIPGLSDDLIESFDEFRSLTEELKVKEVLAHLAIATQHLHESAEYEVKNADYYIFILRLDTEETSVIGFYGDDASVKASERYAELEAEYVHQPHVQLVLVAGGSISALRRAYPNYFHDTAEFVSLVKSVNATWGGLQKKYKKQISQYRQAKLKA